MIQNKENAAVNAIEKLTEVILTSIKNNNDDKQNQIKTNKENKDKDEFNKFFSHQNQNNISEEMEIENQPNQNPQNVFSVEKILPIENKLKTTTKDYTSELARIHNTNLSDPNIPINDAIKVKQQGLKHIETINMLVNTINEMKNK